jgi:colanic acid/amylovoran biosynthesis glycosyltransferase
MESGRGNGVKIAYLVNQYPMASLTFIRREISALEAMGHEVLRFALQPWPDKLVDQQDIDEARITRYAKGGGILGLLVGALKVTLRRPGLFWRALSLSTKVAANSDRSVFRHLAYLAEACVICEWLREESVEHLHAHFATNSAEVAMLAKVLGGPAYSFTVHGPEDFDRAACLSLDRKVAEAAFVTTISSFARSQIFRWIAAEDWAKVRIVRCGLGVEYLESPIAPGLGASRLVNIGRICEQKGQLVLIEAAALVAERGHRFELEIIGDGNLRPQLEAAIRRHGLSELVKLRGWLDNNAVRESLRSARALVLASFAEGLPVVIMEAFALGRPVISTEIAGIPELVQHGRSGWLVTPGEALPLAEAMIAALQASEADIERLAQLGRQAVLERHDVRKEAANLAKLIAAAVRTPAPDYQGDNAIRGHVQ